MKNCSSTYPCSYKVLNVTTCMCNFEYYCDFQLPRDSRTSSLSSNISTGTQVCTCNYSPTTKNGICCTCGLPKSTLTLLIKGGNYE